MVRLVLMVSILSCDLSGAGSNPVLTPNNPAVAQLELERLTTNQGATGSNPVGGSNFLAPVV